MKKTLLTMLLVLSLLLSLLAGCGSSSNAETTESATTESETTESQQAEDSAEPSAQTSASEEAAPESSAAQTASYTIPISEEPLTYSIWMTYAPFIGDMIDTMHDLSVIRGIEETTNIHFDITAVNGADEGNNFQLMIAAGDYTDIITSMSNYATGLEGAVEEGIIMDLADILPEYCPIYWEALSADTNTLMRATTDSGYIPTICVLSPEIGQEAIGIVYRDDWAEEFGMDTPTTFDELYDYLETAHNEKGAVLNLSGTSGIWGDLAAGLNITLSEGSASSTSNNDGGFYVVDGEVRYGNVGEEFQYYLTYMNRLYEAGILDQDFYTDSTNDPSAVARQNFGSGTNPLVATSAANTEDIMTYVEDTENFSMAVLPYVTLDGETDVHIFASDATDLMKDDDVWAFNAELDLEYIEPLLQLVEFLYSDDGYLLTNYGIEGEAYTLDENGNPQWTDLVINNPDGLPYLFSSYLYATNAASGFFPYINDLSRSFYNFNDMQWQIFEDLKTLSDAAYNYPNYASMNTEESTQFAAIATDINTYATTAILQFITGAVDIESGYADYENTLYSMGLQEMIDIKQAAYDRAMERTAAYE